MRPSRIVAPVALGLALVVLAVRWANRPIPSPAIGAPFPHLALAALPGEAALTDAGLRTGQPTLVNLFASWCVPCRAEASALAALRSRGINVVGIAVRDTPAATASFLAATKTRFAAVGLDPHERVQPALASAGIPETWLVDGGGVVRARFQGGVQVADVPRVTAMVDAAR